MSSDRKAVVKNADMDDEMQQSAVELAAAALDKFQIEKDIASYMKKEFDKKYGATWHCVVGRHFGSSLDEGFERGKTINEPITTFTLTNLRSETVYYVCLRVLRRRRSDLMPVLRKELIVLNSSWVSTVSPHLSTTPLALIEQKPNGLFKQAPNIPTILPWQQRNPMNVKAPENYAFEFRCSEAATQNWHLSALIGGLLGVAFAMILGLLLLVSMKRHQWWPNPRHSTGKSLMNTSQDPCLNRKAKNGWHQDPLHSGRSARSSSTRGISEFSGNLREEDEEDEEEEEDPIAEDDEDTEVDTACKSSVRSQAGIYGGSGGTTSSNRHSSVSSIDPREDSSSMTHHLPVNGQLIGKRGSRKFRPDFRENKRVYGGKTLPELVQLVPQAEEDRFAGVKVQIVSPSPELKGTKEDLHSLGQKTPGDGQTASDSSDVEHELFATESIKVCMNRYQRHSVFDTNSTAPPAHRVSERRTTITGTVKSDYPVRADSLHPLTNSQPVPLFGPDIDTVSNLNCQSPTPLFDPQPVSLQPPVLWSPTDMLGQATYSSNCGESWITSPQIDFSPRTAEVNPAHEKVDGFPSASAISTPVAARTTFSCENTNVVNFFIGPDRAPVYAEFIETI